MIKKSNSIRLKIKGWPSQFDRCQLSRRMKTGLVESASVKKLNSTGFIISVLVIRTCQLI